MTGDPPVAEISSDRFFGEVPMTVNLDASGSHDPDGDIVNYEWDWEGDGVYDFDSGSDPTPPPLEITQEGVYTATVRVTDDDGIKDTASRAIYAGDSGGLADDTIFAIPEDGNVQVGQHVRIHVYTNKAAHLMAYMTGCRIVFPTGSHYVADSYDPGVLSPGDENELDGIWLATGGTGILMPPDQFLEEIDLGGGLSCCNFNITPLNGSQFANATGELFSFELEVNDPLTFTFHRYFPDGTTPATYYQDVNQTPDYFWAHDDNAGWPGIDVF